MTNQQTPREKIMQRIAALRVRADDAASSEAEIMTSLDRASKLMDAYEITEADLAMAEATGVVTLEVVTKPTSDLASGRNRHKVQLCMVAIAAYTNTRCVTNGSGQGEYTGDKPDVEMAIYLTEMIKAALDRSYGNYRANVGAVGRGAKVAFQGAMAMRVSERLAQMARERKDRHAQQAEKDRAIGADKSRALVIVAATEAKREAVEIEFRTRYPSLRKTRLSAGGRNGTAASAGRKAGDRVGLGRPVGGSSHARLS